MNHSNYTQVRSLLYVVLLSSFVSLFANVDELDVRTGKNKSKADHSYKIEQEETKKESKKTDKKSSKKADKKSDNKEHAQRK